MVYKRLTQQEKQLTQITFGGKIRINKEHKAILEANTLWNNTVLGGFLKTNFESGELQEVIDWFRSKLHTIIKPKTDLFAFISNKLENNELNKDTIIKVLRKADFNISDIIVKKEEQEIDQKLIDMASDSFAVYSRDIKKELQRKNKIIAKELFFEHDVNLNERYLLSFDDESEGTQRYYQFGGLLDMLIRKESIFPVDEFESSLHPDLLKHFVLSFLVNAKNSQLIATTHLRELLMERDIFRDDVIWFTEKRDDSSTDLFSLADFDSSVIRNTSSVYNAYKVGKLGAMPNLSDYYLDIDNGKN